MIEPTELRIGNWVYRRYYNPHPKTPSFLNDECRIDMIKRGSVNLQFPKGQLVAKIQYEILSGIPLTKDILEECKFENDEITFWKGTALVLGYYSRRRFKYLPAGQIGNPGVEIKFVHQLQNLHFALMQSELEINFK